ncbi:putative CoA-binding protein [Paenibacillus shirakamiensis]|uniref:CoA-binding protein n=1 Tax=Paenibacillus shirakamiensis TaxID=1265935 RepID=A0ABS4JC58_9BACL|nr:CoA-binding protein [Paenibacillus shirakamiensis]MBP1999310.1 putative CoA-binding protein [Paenibacillus shirakamiensis]
MSSFENPSREEIKAILEAAGNIAVVGLSDKSDRTSYMVSEALQLRGYRIIPVNPTVKADILGEKTYASLKDIPEPVDIVNVFRRSEFTPEVAQEATEIGAKVLWLQLGVFSDEANRIAADQGLTVIMDRCIKVEDAVTAPNRSNK